MNIQVTEESKLYYAGIVSVIGFIATAIRSFFDTKNILVGLQLLFCKEFRIKYKAIIYLKSKNEFQINNIEPIMD